jgi:hypothetical protein
MVGVVSEATGATGYTCSLFNYYKYIHITLQRMFVLRILDICCTSIWKFDNFSS